MCELTFKRKYEEERNRKKIKKGSIVRWIKKKRLKLNIGISEKLQISIFLRMWREKENMPD